MIDSFKVDKPICSILINDKELFFTKMTIDMNYCWREKPQSYWDEPKSYVDKERCPEDDTMTITLVGNKDESICVGDKINKINYFFHDSLSFSGEYFISSMESDNYSMKLTVIPINMPLTIK